MVHINHGANSWEPQLSSAGFSDDSIHRIEFRELSALKRFPNSSRISQIFLISQSF